ncbi:MAG TPA: ABC transporter ATP-binding protein [Clostridium sp.]|nr:ABC transporter ATP-binding protein [Clostridium sp.]
MIEIKDLSFGYRENKVLNNISLQIKPELNAIVGPNAAGKSTLMKCIFGLLKPKGEIYYKKKLLSEYTQSDIANFMVYLPQEEEGTPQLTVLETVLLGRLQNLSWKIDDKDLNIVMHILEALCIDNLSSRYLTELSGGQKQMVYIAQVLAKEPEILLMDEPTNNLDMQKQLEFCELLRLIMKKKKLMILVVFHDLNLAAQYADNIIVMDGKGGLYSSGAPKDVINEKMLKDVYGIEGSIHIDNYGTPIISARKSIRKVEFLT